MHAGWSTASIDDMMYDGRRIAAVHRDTMSCFTIRRHYLHVCRSAVSVT